MLLEEDESFYFKSNTTFNHGANVPFNSIFPIVCWGNEVRLSFFLLSSSSSVWGKKKKKSSPNLRKTSSPSSIPFSAPPKKAGIKTLQSGTWFKWLFYYLLASQVTNHVEKAMRRKQHLFSQSYFKGTWDGKLKAFNTFAWDVNVTWILIFSLMHKGVGSFLRKRFHKFTSWICFCFVFCCHEAQVPGLPTSTYMLSS